MINKRDVQTKDKKKSKPKKKSGGKSKSVSWGEKGYMK